MAKKATARKNTSRLERPKEAKLVALRQALRRVNRLHRDIVTLSKAIAKTKARADIELESLARAVLERIGGYQRDIPLEGEARP